MPPVKKEMSIGTQHQLAQNFDNLQLAGPPPLVPNKCEFIKVNSEQCKRKKQLVDGCQTKFCWSHNAVDMLDEDPKKEIERLKKELEEHEAVEDYIVKILKSGGAYEDVLRAHNREGDVVDGKWVDGDAQ